MGNSGEVVPKSWIGRAIARRDIGRTVFLVAVVFEAEPLLHLLEDRGPEAEAEAGDDCAHEELHGHKFSTSPRIDHARARFSIELDPQRARRGSEILVGE